MKVIYISIFIFLLISLNKLYSQDTIHLKKNHSQSWLSFGIGGNNIGIAGDIGLSFMHMPGRIITPKIMLSEEFDIYGNGANSLVEPGLLYGFVFEKGILSVSISGGLSLFFYHKKLTSYYNAEDYTTISVPVEVKFLIIPSGKFALGLSYTGSFNGVRSYNGLMFNLCFGNFKPYKKK